MNSGRDLAPPAYRVVNEGGKSAFVLVCEHASRFIPEHYVGLGLSSADLERHIAWDIGAERVAVELSRLLDAQLILANYSRLIIDLNRPLDSATSIPEVSETTRIPGNSGISLDERRHRASEYFTPFHQRLTQLLDAREAAEKAFSDRRRAQFYSLVQRRIAAVACREFCFAGQRHSAVGWQPGSAAVPQTSPRMSRTGLKTTAITRFPFTEKRVGWTRSWWR